MLCPWRCFVYFCGCLCIVDSGILEEDHDLQNWACYLRFSNRRMQMTTLSLGAALPLCLASRPMKKKQTAGGGRCRVRACGGVLWREGHHSMRAERDDPWRSGKNTHRALVLSFLRQVWNCSSLLLLQVARMTRTRLRWMYNEVEHLYYYNDNAILYLVSLYEFLCKICLMLIASKTLIVITSH